MTLCLGTMRRSKIILGKQGKSLYISERCSSSNILRVTNSLRLAKSQDWANFQKQLWQEGKQSKNNSFLKNYDFKFFFSCFRTWRG